MTFLDGSEIGEFRFRPRSWVSLASPGTGANICEFSNLVRGFSGQHEGCAMTFLYVSSIGFLNIFCFLNPDHDVRRP